MHRTSATHIISLLLFYLKFIYLASYLSVIRVISSSQHHTTITRPSLHIYRSSGRMLHPGNDSEARGEVEEDTKEYGNRQRGQGFAKH
jgi:hypothetical protein